MSLDATAMLGQEIQGFALQSQLCGGSFAVTYVGQAGHEKRVFKFGKEISGHPRTPDRLTTDTQALMFAPDGMVGVIPDPGQLLEIETNRMTKWAAVKSVAHVSALRRHQELCFYSMPYYGADTMRQIITKKGRALQAFGQVLDAIAAIHAFDGEYHGDIKPENILLCGDAIILIDPGYFGPLDTTSGSIDRVVVSTPVYYPLLEPDDMLAAGAMLWEIVLGHHPFMPAGAQITGSEKIADDLTAWVQQSQAVGQHFLDPILQLALPSEIDPKISKVAEAALLKAIKLRLDQNGNLSCDPGFVDARALSAALHAVDRAGWKI